MSYSATTPRLLLPQFSGTDGFDFNDFDTAFSILDAAPGAFVCTSTTHPTWGTPQAGMFIYEKDTQELLVWTGTAFTIPANTGNYYGGVRTLSINSTVFNGTTTGFSMASLTSPPRANALLQTNVSVTTNWYASNPTNSTVFLAAYLRYSSLSGDINPGLITTTDNAVQFNSTSNSRVNFNLTAAAVVLPSTVYNLRLMVQAFGAVGGTPGVTIKNAQATFNFVDGQGVQ